MADWCSPSDGAPDSCRQAYKAGELDPAFEVLTVFEQRRVTAAQAPDADLAWMRETMYNDFDIILDHFSRSSRRCRTPSLLRRVTYSYCSAYDSCLRVLIGVQSDVVPDPLLQEQLPPGPRCLGRLSLAVLRVGPHRGVS